MKKIFTSLMLLAALSVPVYLSANAALAAAEDEPAEEAEAVTIEVDYTSRLGITAAAWTGSSGLCATQFAPSITTKDGRTAQLAENYQTSVDATGDLMTQTVRGLANGTYRVSIYANAFFTDGRGFTSDIEDGAEDVCYVFAGSGENRVEKFITAHIATSTTANDLRTLDNVVVTDGTLVVGLGKAKAGTNWHTVQVYEITAIVDATELLNTANADYELVKDEDMSIAAKQALESAKAALDAEVTEATLTAFTEAISAAKASAEAYAAAAVKLAAMKDLVEATNFYTPEAYAAYYGDAAAAFEDKTLGTAEAAALQNPSLTTGWHAAITVDNFLLSVWDVEPDFAGYYYINTWSVEGDNDGTGFRVPFFEYWTGDANSLDEKVLTAKVEGLQPGKYNVSAWVRVRAKNGVTAEEADGIAMQVAGGEPVDVTEGVAVGQFNLAEYTAAGVVGEDGVLTFTFNVGAENNISWLSFKNVKYSPIYEATNLDFSLSTPVSAGVRTYDYDIVEGTEETSGMQPVEGWDIAIENGNARAAGVFAYGSEPFLGGADYVAPAAGPDGEAEGNALGLLGVWTGSVQYTQPVTLVAGNYVLTIPVYNAGGTSVPVKSLIGFIAEDGTEYLAPAKAYAVGQWTTETISFTLDKTINGVFSLGYQGQNVGSGTAQHLFVDAINCKLVTEVDLARAELEAALAEVEPQVSALDGLQGQEILFLYTDEAINSIVDAYNAGTELYASEAATAQELKDEAAQLREILSNLSALPVNEPGDAAYALQQKASGLFLSLYNTVDEDGNATNGVRLADEAYNLGWVPAEDGGYLLTDGHDLYVGLAGTNNWTMSALAENALTINPALVLVDGEPYYTLNELKGGIGTDGTEVGAACYADKSQAKVGDRALWSIVKVSDTPVSVQSLEQPAAAAAAIFDLSGRRVNKAQKGIYIVGGKKVVK